MIRIIEDLEDVRSIGFIKEVVPFKYMSCQNCDTVVSFRFCSAFQCVTCKANTMDMDKLLQLKHTRLLYHFEGTANNTAIEV